MHRRANYAPFIAAIVKAHPGQPARPYMRPGKIEERQTSSLLPSRFKDCESMIQTVINTLRSCGKGWKRCI